MPRGELSAEEDSAGKIVAKHLVGRYEARDVRGAPDATHDLDIVLADGRTVVLEVTSTGDGSVEELHRLLLGRAWEAPTLRHHWWLGVPDDPQTRVKALMQKIITHLAVLEQHDVEEVGGLRHRRLPADTAPEVAQAARAIFDLGADRATRLDPPKPGETPLLLPSPHGGVTGSSGLLNEAVERCAEKKAAKLRAADGDERHLFVWLLGSASGVELAMATLPLPSSPPALSAGVDVVWVATGPAFPDAPSGRLWRVRPSGRWEKIGASVG